MTAVRTVKAARAATVTIANESEPRGHGLLLELGGWGYVLTCHHVVEPIPEPARGVVVHPPGEKPIRLDATLVKKLSRFERDAVVLKVGKLVRADQPWLHALGPGYGGGLAATVLLAPRKGKADSFLATVGPPVVDPFVVRGVGSVSEYVLPDAHPLHQAGNATPGISGGVVLCEEGVVGLVHFAHPETGTVGRTAMMNPLTAWAEGWDELERRIQPFVDATLARLATVVRADADELAEVLPIQRFIPNVYVAPPAQRKASAVLAGSRSLLLIGKPSSGKTRIVRELLRSKPDAAVVIPTRKSPPLDFASSGLADRDVFVVVDNLHDDKEFLDPRDWWDSIRAVNSKRTSFVGTCRREDWERVRRIHDRLASQLEQATVHTSGPPPGRNLTKAEGWKLAQKLGMTETQFRDVFDGTPGSLLAAGTTAAAANVPPGAGTGVVLKPLHAHRATPSNVPAFASQFVGRKKELRELKNRIRTRRFVTITGPSGCGKTRLSFHVAAQLREEYPDGVWVADLSPYRTPAHVPSVIAQVVGLGDAVPLSRIGRLVAHLAEKRVLLVLNGPNDVREATARVTEALVNACPGVACLVTCREPLGAPDEDVYALEPFASSEYSTANAVELFIERAREVKSKMRYTKRDIVKVEAITRRVSGNALAIELIAGEAARRALGAVAAKVTERIERAEASHESGIDPAVAAAVDVVSEGLKPDERLFFETLCVFVGGFTLDAAEALGADAGLPGEEVPTLLRGLIDHQLVLVDRSQGADRFRMLETLRQDGRRRMADARRLSEIERHHARYFVRVAERALQARGGSGEAVWLDLLDAEVENLRAALLWALPSRKKDDDGIEIRIKLGANLWWFWYQRSHLAEGRRWLRKLRAALAGAPQGKAESEEQRRLHAEVLNGAGTFEYLVCNLAEAEALHREALAIRRTLSSERWVAGSLNNLGLVARRRGDREQAAELFEAALEISRARGNAFWESMHLNNLGILLRDWKKTRAAREAQEESLTIAARLGASWGLAQALAALGNLEADDAKLERAREFLERSLAIQDEIQNPQGIADSLAGLARLQRLAGRFEASAQLYREALDKVERLGDRAVIAEGLEGLGMALVERDPAAAARAFGAAAQLRDSIDFPLSPRAKAELRPALAAARKRLGTRFRREHRTGREARLNAAIADLQVTSAA